LQTSEEKIEPLEPIVIIVKRADAKPIHPSEKRTTRVANLPWAKIKHLASKYPARPPSR
jgi:hypothetical protein